jgi:outer membrane protein assembly factor BamB
VIKDVDLKNGVYATPVVNDGRLFVLARSGNLFSIDLDSYSVQDVAH